MTIFIGKFYVLEGATLEGSDTLAVGFNEQEMIDFLMELTGHEKYIGFRLSICGGHLTQPQTSTHAGPTTRN